MRGHGSGLLCKERQHDSKAGRGSLLLEQRENPPRSEQELQSKSHDSQQDQPQPAGCSQLTLTQQHSHLVPGHTSVPPQRWPLAKAASSLGKWSVIPCSCPDGSESWIRNKLHGFFNRNYCALRILCMCYSPHIRSLL